MDRSTVLAIVVVAATALGIAAYYYGSDSLPKSADEKARAFFEVWKAGPWAVRARDMKGTPKVVELRVHPIKVRAPSSHVRYSLTLTTRAVETSQPGR
jgi:hypothetical protein